MKTYSISQLAKSFGLSRSTLLYYDRINLLTASQRSPAGYRLYTDGDRERLERICILRHTGLSLSDIEILLSKSPTPSVEILENRLKETEQQILSLRNQQHTIIAMLKEMTSDAFRPVVDKQMWIKMLEAAGMDESAMLRWHAEFESRSPNGHHDFLLSLGIPEEETKQIQEHSRNYLLAEE